MAMIYLENANHSGPLTLMTVADYKRRAKIQDDKKL